MFQGAEPQRNFVWPIVRANTADLVLTSGWVSNATALKVILVLFS